jgi:uncharacterized membrane protein
MAKTNPADPAVPVPETPALSKSVPRGLRGVYARPRLFWSVVFGLVIWFLLPLFWSAHAITRALVAWNAATLLYLVLALVMMARSTTDNMRVRAKAQDEGEYAVLVLVICAALATLGAIGAELFTAKDLHGWDKGGHIALAGLTVFTTWAFTQVMFALHYAHVYYRIATGKFHGLDLEGSEPVDYFDFLYFASIIGTSAQTADVAFNTQEMRRIGLVHSVLAFFFNTILLALTINIASSLL